MPVPASIIVNALAMNIPGAINNSGVESSCMALISINRILPIGSEFTGTFDSQCCIDL
ncbi:MAG: hypothetical protein ACOYT8_06845 [Candidatus Dependentiae bacterium]